MGSSIAAEEVRDRSSSKQCGLGLTFLKSTDKGYPVKRVKEGGAAESAGSVASKDILVSIDGVSLVGKDMKSLARLMMGPEGSVAVLQVLKRGAGEPCVVEIVRSDSTAV